MVYPRQHIQRLEEERLSIMGPWKSYASLVSSYLLVSKFIPRFRSGCRKKHLVVRGFSFASVVENSYYG